MALWISLVMVPSTLAGGKCFLAYLLDMIRKWIVVRLATCTCAVHSPHAIFPTYSTTQVYIVSYTMHMTCTKRLKLSFPCWLFWESIPELHFETPKECFHDLKLEFKAIEFWPVGLIVDQYSFQLLRGSWKSGTKDNTFLLLMTRHVYSATNFKQQSTP